MSLPSSKSEAKEEKEKWLEKRMEEMRVKNEKFRQRHAEVERDRIEAEKMCSSVTVPKTIPEKMDKKVKDKSETQQEYKVEREWDIGKRGWDEGDLDDSEVQPDNRGQPRRGYFDRRKDKKEIHWRTRYLKTSSYNFRKGPRGFPSTRYCSNHRKSQRFSGYYPTSQRPSGHDFRNESSYTGRHRRAQRVSRNLQPRILPPLANILNSDGAINDYAMNRFSNARKRVKKWIKSLKTIKMWSVDAGKACKNFTSSYECRESKSYCDKPQYAWDEEEDFNAKEQNYCKNKESKFNRFQDSHKSSTSDSSRKESSRANSDKNRQRLGIRTKAQVREQCFNRQSEYEYQSISEEEDAEWTSGDKKIFSGLKENKCAKSDNQQNPSYVSKILYNVDNEIISKTTQYHKNESTGRRLDQEDNSTKKVVTNFQKKNKVQSKENIRTWSESEEEMKKLAQHECEKARAAKQAEYQKVMSDYEKVIKKRSRSKRGRTGSDQECDFNEDAEWTSGDKKMFSGTKENKCAKSDNQQNPSYVSKILYNVDNEIPPTSSKTDTDDSILQIRIEDSYTILGKDTNLPRDSEIDLSAEFSDNDKDECSHVFSSPANSVEYITEVKNHNISSQSELASFKKANTQNEPEASALNLCDCGGWSTDSEDDCKHDFPPTSSKTDTDDNILQIRIEDSYTILGKDTNFTRDSEMVAPQHQSF